MGTPVVWVGTPLAGVDTPGTLVGVGTPLAGVGTPGTLVGVGTPAYQVGSLVAVVDSLLFPVVDSPLFPMEDIQAIQCRMNIGVSHCINSTVTKF